MEFTELLTILYADLFKCETFQSQIVANFHREDCERPSNVDHIRIHLPVPLGCNAPRVQADHFRYVTRVAFYTYPIVSQYFQEPAFPTSISINNTLFSDTNIFLHSTVRRHIPLPSKEFDLLNLPTFDTE